MNHNMFCYQCQEAAGGLGCTIKGVCGKDDTTAQLQDALVYAIKGLAATHQALRKQGKTDSIVGKLIWEGLFTTITNANFDPEDFISRIMQTVSYGEKLQKEHALPVPEFARISIKNEEDIDSLKKTGAILNEKDENLRSLKELITYGIKGIAAYAYHASHLGFEDDRILDFVEKALVATVQLQDMQKLVELTLETGKHGVMVMELLDRANTSSFGNPEPTHVSITTRNHPGILISGHDLKDLLELLEQTKDTGIDVYTHSEMLPAHYYPVFKKYPNFAGNYGNAWWKQTEEFESFRGPILFTTNCLVPPKESYKDRVYTTGPVSYPGLRHIPADVNGRKDFSSIIEHAKKCPPPLPIEHGEIIGGFAHATLTSLTETILDAVNKGLIKRFVVMAGCDGRMPSRNYYTQFAQELPSDTVILTAGCAKYRYNKLGLGDIHGIPRVLDAGQCNDSYSLVAAALHLQKTLGLKDINDLPIIYNIAWYEQKAVIVLLALLSLGVKNIRLGPTLPAFLSPAVLELLVETFGITAPTTVEEDLTTWGLAQ
ncbi:hydroxylamine reductase [Thermospira aquatica]|uniref:Hydroxylamine reductase n=1 Tax=Thermospira aquatica TaxID=2828656 RepID=A0AAX3BBR3_9SPIR|nr:hydroxylamine reductase [Thermospira aquatica]URA09717.1 hydroxylamine reductase [Thermospira aquatica]